MDRGHRAIAGAILIHAVMVSEPEGDLMGLMRVGLFVFGLALIVGSFGGRGKRLQK